MIWSVPGLVCFFLRFNTKIIKIAKRTRPDQREIMLYTHFKHSLKIFNQSQGSKELFIILNWKIFFQLSPQQRSKSGKYPKLRLKLKWFNSSQNCEESLKSKVTLLKDKHFANWIMRLQRRDLPLRDFANWTFNYSDTKSQ